VCWRKKNTDVSLFFSNFFPGVDAVIAVCGPPPCRVGWSATRRRGSSVSRALLGAFDPAEAAATWPPVLRQPVKAQHCPRRLVCSCRAGVAASGGLAPLVRALAARRDECQCQAISFGARVPDAPAASHSYSHRCTMC